jgi:hypothetical protein
MSQRVTHDAQALLRPELLVSKGKGLCKAKTDTPCCWFSRREESLLYMKSSSKFLAPILGYCKSSTTLNATTRRQMPLRIV